ncbi:MAG: sialate O-acetylesterase [Oscillospiraceae bacterium]|nr:sialate O-acetylesterase [Oscillospiraceae bacterium]
MDQLTLFPYFQDHAVLQRDQVWRLWGKAKPLSQVSVRLFEKQTEQWRFDTCSRSDGRWALDLPALCGGESFELLVESDEQLIRLRDLAAGDVFILFGQSNMELPLSRTLDLLPDPAAIYHLPQVRLLQPQRPPCFDQHNQDWPRTGVWQVAQGQALSNMSAVGISFAQAYQTQRPGVPVGLISLAVGGTPIEAWLPQADWADDPQACLQFASSQDEACRTRIEALEQHRDAQWYQLLDRRDPLLDDNAKLKDPLPPDGWSRIRMPALFTDTALDQFHGSVWLKRTFYLTKLQIEQLGRSVLLYLDGIIDADQTYLNGCLVGATTYQYPPRRYPLPPCTLREGANDLLIRLIINRDSGGLIPGRFYGLKGTNRSLDLSGDDWLLTRGSCLPALPQDTFWPSFPGGLYYSLIQPVKDLAVCGGLWYQGESNDPEPERYEALLRRFTERWQSDFGADRPLVCFQLSAYAEPRGLIRPLAWAKIREAQRRCLSGLPKGGLVVTVDCGETHDLHPQQKQIPGQRAAALMLRLLGHDQGEVSGPQLLKVCRPKPDLIRLDFSHAGAGLQLPAAADRCFKLGYGTVWLPPAALRSQGSSLQLQLPGDLMAAEQEQELVLNLRYNYTACPLANHLKNPAGLPASPFEIRLPRFPPDF